MRSCGLLLETVVPTNVVSLPLKHVKNTIYATAIDQDKYLNNTRMYLAISAETSRGSDHPQGSATGEGLLGDRTSSSSSACALPGVTLTHVPSPPSAIPG